MHMSVCGHVMLIARTCTAHEGVGLWCGAVELVDGQTHIRLMLHDGAPESDLISIALGTAHIDAHRCRCPDDVLVSQELTKLRKQQKAEQKAVDDLFRNKMPAPKATPGIGDSTNENYHSTAAQRSAINDAQRYTAGETWFYAMAKVVIEFLSSVLRALGLATKVTASANS